MDQLPFAAADGTVWSNDLGQIFVWQRSSAASAEDFLPLDYLKQEQQVPSFDGQDLIVEGKRSAAIEWVEKHLCMPVLESVTTATVMASGTAPMPTMSMWAQRINGISYWSAEQNFRSGFPDMDVADENVGRMFFDQATRQYYVYPVNEWPDAHNSLFRCSVLAGMTESTMGYQTVREAVVTVFRTLMDGAPFLDSHPAYKILKPLMRWQ